jgi:hypothetical protein
MADDNSEQETGNEEGQRVGSNKKMDLDKKDSMLYLLGFLFFLLGSYTIISSLAVSEIPAQIFRLLVSILLFIFGLILINLSKKPQKTKTSENDNAIPPSSDNELNFSAKNILIGITTINIVLFIGGTVLGGVSIPTIKQQMNNLVEGMKNADKDLLKAKQKLQSTNNEFEQIREELTKERNETKRIIKEERENIINTLTSGVSDNAIKSTAIIKKNTKEVTM